MAISAVPFSTFGYRDLESSTIALSRAWTALRKTLSSVKIYSAVDPQRNSSVSCFFECSEIISYVEDLMMLCGAVVFHQRVNPRVERRSEVLSIALNKDHLYLSLSPSTSLNLLVQAVLRV